VSIEDPGGNVLVIADAPQVGEDLCRHILASGEQPMLLAGAEKSLLEKGSDETIDLVVTEMNGSDPSSVAVLEHLLDGDVLFGVPQLHVVADDELCERLRELNPDVAAVFIGASPEPEEFRTRVRLSAEIGRLRREVTEEAIRDELTGSHNRRYLVTRLEQEFSRAKRHHTPVSLVLFEIESIKAINEHYGLEAGDQAIRQFGGMLRAQVRKEDVHGRWSATVFAALLGGVPHRGAAVFANKIRGDVEEFRVPVGDDGVQMKISAGISAYDPGCGMDSTIELVASAERALDEAKQRGGSRVFIDETVMRRKRRLVVIADTDPRLLELAEDLLAMDDFSVVRAETEAALLETLEVRRPDVLVLDLAHLADGDPAPLIERIRSMFADAPVPIIGLAATPGPSLDRIGRVGVDRYLTKPFSVSVLRSVARDVIGQLHRDQAPDRSV
jgi:diguanylate cyclase (GGDEF)-like protein